MDGRYEIDCVTRKLLKWNYFNGRQKVMAEHLKKVTNSSLIRKKDLFLRRKESILN